MCEIKHITSFYRLQETERQGSQLQLAIKVYFGATWVPYPALCLASQPVRGRKHPQEAIILVFSTKKFYFTKEDFEKKIRKMATQSQ